MRSRRPFPLGQSPVRRRSGPWRSSTSSRAPVAAPTRAPQATTASTAASIRVSRFAQHSSKTASPTSRPAAASSPTPSLRSSTRRPVTRRGRWSKRSRSPAAARCGCSGDAFEFSFRYTHCAMLGILLVLFGYVLGSVPTGYLVGRALGVDVRKVGSGNIGTANVLRAAGKWAAVLTLLGDMLKGLIPVVVARLVTENAWLIAAVALAAVVGHCWPVFLRFKGGKAVATGAGTTIGLAPLVGLGLFAFWWAVVLLSRYTSLGAISVMVVSPVVFWLSGQPLPYVLYTIVGGALVLWRHRENARALIKGTERKVGERTERGS